MAQNDATAVVFGKFTGIRNAIERSRLRPSDLWQATDVDIDDTGILSRRAGFGAAVIAQGLHSCQSFQSNTLTLGVCGTDLVIVNPDRSLEVVRAGLTAGLRMSYAEVNDEVHYTNGQVIGFVKNRADGTFPSISKLYGSRMPAGHMIAHYNGRLYVARGGYVAISEAYDFGRTSPRKDWLWFPGYVTLMAPVVDGMYVAYGKTAFLAGAGPKAFVHRPIADYDAVPHTAISLNAELIAGEQPMTGSVVWWQSVQGQCLGMAGGQMINLALSREYDAPTGIEGATCVRTNRKGTVQVLTILRAA